MYACMGGPYNLLLKFTTTRESFMHSEIFEKVNFSLYLRIDRSADWPTAICILHFKTFDMFFMLFFALWLYEWDFLKISGSLFVFDATIFVFFKHFQKCAKLFLLILFEDCKQNEIFHSIITVFMGSAGS